MRASRRSVRRMTPRLHVADSPLEALEARALLSTLMIDSIYRTTSLSPFNGTIQDQVKLSPSLAGKVDTLVGYQVTEPGAPNNPYSYGGTGFEVHFTNTTSQPAKVTIDWGDGTPPVQNQYNAQPTPITITVPHVYLQTGNDTVKIMVSAGDKSTTADITTTVSYVLSDPSGIFIIGDQNNDQVLLNEQPDGTVILTSNFTSPTGQPVAIGRAPEDSVYVQTLQGNDHIGTTPQFRDSLWVDAGAGNDTIYDQGSGSDHLSGGPGNNVIIAGSGNDFLYGGSGNDTLIAGTGNDVLYGGSGNETLIGGPGQDQLFGGAGNDTLIAGTGNTFMLGGVGSAYLYGGPGKDILIGGYDNAEYEYRPQFVQQIMADWASGDPKTVEKMEEELTGTNPFGPNLANNGTPDHLYGGSGENLLVPHAVGNPSIDDVYIQQPSNHILKLDDPLASNVNVQFVNPTNYVSTSGADIIGNPTHTTIVLGRNNPDNNAIVKVLGSPLIQPDQFHTYYGEKHPGELLVLYVNVSDPNFWADYDEPYLHYGVERGDFFIMSSNTFDPITLYNDSGQFMGLPNFLGQEVAYMEGQSNYAYDPMRHTFFKT